MSLARKLAAIAGGSVLGIMAAIATASPAAAQDADPPGNNGTIKVDNEPFDSHPNNQPHVGCVFEIDFYGYDEGDLSADVTFEAHAPTTREDDDQVLLTDTVFIGEDAAGGGTDLDASRQYTLDFTGITPHSKQGFHVKLTINAEGSIGAALKHKVFWVTGCVPTETPSNGTPSNGTPSNGTPSNGTPGGGAPPGGEVLPKTGSGFPVGNAALLAIFLLAAGGALLVSRGVIQLPYRRRH